MSFAAHSVPPERDLFDDQAEPSRVMDEAAARERLAAAEAAVATARRRYQLAPHGGHGERLSALRAAVHEALKAAAALRSLCS